nr:piggyBac transposable element-derived protein 1-like [Leptinotarsa decemlineata]
MLPREDEIHGRLHKLRPIIKALSLKFQRVPLEKSLSVDEQLCATKARHHLKQYMPAKPHKWGYKLFVLCGASGFSYNFEIYSDAENQPKFRLPDEPDLGAASNTVIRLSREVPTNLNHVVYFDNYYTSVPLMSFLASRGIFPLGTVRRNRAPNNCKLPSEEKI